MGFFNKSDQQTNIQTNATVISNGTTIKGNIVSGCALYIDGIHGGKIESKDTVTIGSEGKVDGEISAKYLSVTGYFMGTADCEEVDILSGGNVKGKIISNHLSISHSCYFEGESIKRANKIVPTSSNN